MANQRGNPKNLVVPSSELARKNGRKGGLAKARNDRERRSQQQIAHDLLYKLLTDSELDQVTCLKDYKGKNISAGEAALVAQMSKAINEGDAKAYMLVRDTAGEKPADRVEISTDIAQAHAEISSMVETFIEDEAKS